MDHLRPPNTPDPLCAAGRVANSQAVITSGSPGSQLLVEFAPRGDCLGHTVSLVAPDGQPHLLLASLEEPVDDWPASPPLQSLSVEDRPLGQRVALLVGMAGKSHWSASIETAPAAAKLVFDVACRHVQPPRLGSRYRILAPFPLPVSIQAEQATVSWTDETLLIEPLPVQQSGTTRWRYSITATR